MQDDWKSLGFGFLRLPSLTPEDPSAIDMEQVTQMVDTYMSAGFRYFDTAYSYLEQKSECYLRQALVERYPRDTFVLATKLPCLEMKAGEEPEKYFREQLRKCGVDYFDVYLLHGLNAQILSTVEANHCFSFLEQCKRDGLAKQIGFSFHDTPEVLDRILTSHPNVDLVQIQLNYLDWENPNVQSKACLEVCRRHGKGVIVMEPIKGGSLSKVPAKAEALMRSYAPIAAPASWALRFAASQPGVKVVLSGMSTVEQIVQNAAVMKELQPLCQEETAILVDCARLLRAAVAIPCTGCSYCTKGCPLKIAIPRYFSLYNENELDGWQANAKGRYAKIAETNGRASSCIGCGQCERICPQHLPVITHLQQVARRLER